METQNSNKHKHFIPLLDEVRDIILASRPECECNALLFQCDDVRSKLDKILKDLEELDVNERTRILTEWNKSQGELLSLMKLGSNYLK